MFKVKRAGLETTVQDYPGRTGFWSYGISPAGPLDSLSFRLGNLLVGNSESLAGLEMQFVGPELEFDQSVVFAVTGGDNKPVLNGEAVPMWTANLGRPGDVLSFGFATCGARSYLLFSGGIDVPVVMGSRSTHVHTKLGGYSGRALCAGDVVTIGDSSENSSQNIGRSIAEVHRPEFLNQWEVRVTLGPYHCYLNADDMARFFGTSWIVSSKSNRIGYRLEGPDFEFSSQAHSKPPENGGDPSNIMDYGCPIGAVNICGQTPTVLLVDGPSSTGYISPFTVITRDLGKIGQARPGDQVRFNLATESELQDPAELLEERFESLLA